MLAKVTPDGQASLPAKWSVRHRLTHGDEVIVETSDDAIVPRAVEQVVSRAQQLSRALLRGKDAGSVDDFLAERRLEASAE